MKDLFGNDTTPPETTAQRLTRHYGLEGGVQSYEFAVMGEANRRGWEAVPMRELDECVRDAEQYLLNLMEV